MNLYPTPATVAMLYVIASSMGGNETKVAPMRYKAKSIAALQLALGSLPDKMRVEVETDIGVSAKTVGDLRKLTEWPANLAIITPLGSDPAGPHGRRMWLLHNRHAGAAGGTLRQA
jgi:hypothetical protein